MDAAAAVNGVLPTELPSLDACTSEAIIADETRIERRIGAQRTAFNASLRRNRSDAAEWLRFVLFQDVAQRRRERGKDAAAKQRIATATSERKLAILDKAIASVGALSKGCWNLELARLACLAQLRGRDDVSRAWDATLTARASLPDAWVAALRRERTSLDDFSIDRSTQRFDAAIEACAIAAPPNEVLQLLGAKASLYAAVGRVGTSIAMWQLAFEFNAHMPELVASKSHAVQVQLFDAYWTSQALRIGDASPYAQSPRNPSADDAAHDYIRLDAEDLDPAAVQDAPLLLAHCGWDVWFEEKQHKIQRKKRLRREARAAAAAGTAAPAPVPAPAAMPRLPRASDFFASGVAAAPPPPPAATVSTIVKASDAASGAVRVVPSAAMPVLRSLHRAYFIAAECEALDCAAAEEDATSTLLVMADRDAAAKLIAEWRELQRRAAESKRSDAAAAQAQAQAAAAASADARSSAAEMVAAPTSFYSAVHGYRIAAPRHESSSTRSTNEYERILDELAHAHDESQEAKDAERRRREARTGSRAWRERQLQDERAMRQRPVPHDDRFVAWAAAECSDVADAALDVGWQGWHPDVIGCIPQIESVALAVRKG
jgi:hypothetical protein